MDAGISPKMKRWAVTRRKGKGKFVIQIGVLGWGLPMFVLMTFLSSRESPRLLVPSMILLFAVIWVMTGAVFGWTVWTLAERKYQKYLRT